MGKMVFHQSDLYTIRGWFCLAFGEINLSSDLVLIMLGI